MNAVEVAGTMSAPPLTPERTTPEPAWAAVDPRTRTAWSFTTALSDALALRLDLGYGTGYRNADVPADTDFNGVRVHDRVDAPTLLADVATVTGGVRGARSHITVLAEPVALELLPALVVAGYTPARTLVMARTAAASARARANVSIRRAAGMADAAVARAHWAATRPDAGPAELAQLDLAEALRGLAARTHRLAVWGGAHRTAAAPVSAVLSTEAHGVRELSRLATVPDQRGRGLATTVVLAALAEHRSDLVFARVPHASPAQALLGRCGFTVTGTLWEFTRPGA